MKQHSINNHFTKIANSYDISSEMKIHGLNPVNYLPAKYFADPEFGNFVKCQFNSGTPDIKKFLNPQKGDKYLDLGCYLNLYTYRLYKWPCQYYGIDISKNVVKILKKIIKERNLKVGGVFCGKIDKLPFKDNFFNISTCLNVFEYFRLIYIKISLSEIHRVMQNNSRLIIDIPNINHSALKLAYKIDSYFGRDNLFNYPEEKFEKLLFRKYEIIKKDSSGVMIRYYLKIIK